MQLSIFIQMVVHGSNYESMYDSIPKEMLPEEYGGEGGTVQEIAGTFNRITKIHIFLLVSSFSFCSVRILQFSSCFHLQQYQISLLSNSLLKVLHFQSLHMLPSLMNITRLRQNIVNK